VSKQERHGLWPGDRIRVRFGGHLVEGTVVSVRNHQIQVALDIEGADEPFAGLYDEDQLMLA
jgi:hypothetical protein